MSCLYSFLPFSPAAANKREDDDEDKGLSVGSLDFLGTLLFSLCLIGRGKYGVDRFSWMNG